MTFDEYQKEAIRTANMNLPDEMKLATFALGLGGEAGEVQDMLKKHLGHGHPLDKTKLAKELGDVLWYIAALADANGLHIEGIAAQNILKLRARYPQGFSTQDSLNRKDTP